MNNNTKKKLTRTTSANIHAQIYKQRKEEGKEKRKREVQKVNILSSSIPIVFGSSNSKHNKHGDEPGNQMVYLLQ